MDAMPCKGQRDTTGTDSEFEGGPAVSEFGEGVSGWAHRPEAGLVVRRGPLIPERGLLLELHHGVLLSSSRRRGRPGPARGRARPGRSRLFLADHAARRTQWSTVMFSSGMPRRL